MIVRSLEDVAGTRRETLAPTFSSRRLVLADDGLGFSFHDTILCAGPLLIDEHHATEEGTR
ncbi:MAG: ectoine synthase [Nitriliruptorales bacterium]